MARVNHNYIKKLIIQKKKKTNDRQFFTSAAVSAHFADIIAAQTRRYHFTRRVKVRVIWEPKRENLIGVTNNDVILVNAGHPLVTKSYKDRPSRYMMVYGAISHELGHILYSDFLILQTYAQRMLSRVWYPEKPILASADDRRNEADIWDYCNSDPKRHKAFVNSILEMSNILEDGYIESKMLDRYPGTLGANLQFFRDTRFKTCPTLTDCIESEDEPGGHIWLSIQQLILSYVLWGEIKYGAESLSDERVQLLFSLLPILDQALTTQVPKERLNVVNAVIIRCWPYIRSFLEMVEKMVNEAGEGEMNERASGIMSRLAGSSSQGSGDSVPVLEKPGAKHNSSVAAKRAATAQKAGASKLPDSDENEDEEEKSAGVAGDEDGDQSEQDGVADVASEDDLPVDYSGSGDSDEIQDVKSEEGGRIPCRTTSEVYIPTSGEITREDYTGAAYEKAASDIERLLDRVAEKVVHSDLEKQRTNELNALANEIAYGDIHAGVDKHIRRIPEVDETHKEQYLTVAPALLKISSKLQKSITQQLKDQRRGGKQTNLYTGRKLHVHALPRNDGKAFYNKKLPNDTPELAIALLLDESGSMGWGDRATYARATAVIVHDFCQSLGIPIMVYGHSTGSGVDLYSYAEFDTIGRDDKYRLMDISSRGSNRDGAALRYVMERLSKRSEDVKLLILVSDGQPADSGYGGSAAEADLRGVKKDCERKGILLIAAAIGDDKPSIERIYGDSFMDITDLEKMPKKFTDVIKRHIRI